MVRNKYAVVIVTYNRLELLKECVYNAMNQTMPFNNIYIVDNNSTDGTKEYLSKLKSYENVHIFTLDENIGGAGGFNYGLSKVTMDNDYVLLIDDDAIISLDYIERIDASIEDGIQAYSGTVYRSGKIDLLHRRRITNAIFLKDEVVPLEEYSNNSFIYDSSSFCGLVVKMTLVQEIGLPRKDFFIWHDDSEYSLRISKYTTIKNVNSAVLDHKVLTKEEAGLSWKTYYGFRNYIVSGREHSVMPFLFLIRRYCFHLMACVYYAMKCILNSKDRIYYRNCYIINKTVIKDVAHNKMGISDVIKPGFNIRQNIL